MIIISNTDNNNDDNDNHNNDDNSNKGLLKPHIPGRLGVKHLFIEQAIHKHSLKIR